MARRTRNEYPGAVYHVFARGVEKRDIFLDRSDFVYFLYLCNALSKSHEIILHSYCLMHNHFHLLIETPQANLSSAMKYLKENYSMKFNKKYERAGTLFQSRFREKEVLDDEYFLQVSKYIHMNPIEANLVQQIEQWEWSSFPAFVNKSAPLFCLNRDKILSFFSNKSPLKDFKEYTYVEFDDEAKKDFLGSEFVDDKSNISNINLENEYSSLMKSIGQYDLKEVTKIKMLNYCFNEKYKVSYNEIAKKFACVKYNSLKKSIQRFRRELRASEELKEITSSLING